MISVRRCLSCILAIALICPQALPAGSMLAPAQTAAPVAEAFAKPIDGNSLSTTALLLSNNYFDAPAGCFYEAGETFALDQFTTLRERMRATSHMSDIPMDDVWACIARAIEHCAAAAADDNDWTWEQCELLAEQIKGAGDELRTLWDEGRVSVFAAIRSGIWGGCSTVRGCAILYGTAARGMRHMRA